MLITLFIELPGVLLYHFYKFGCLCFLVNLVGKANKVDKGLGEIFIVAEFDNRNVVIIFLAFPLAQIDACP